MEEKKQIDAKAILDKIIASTFTRYANVDIKAFLQEIGVEIPEDKTTERVLLEQKWKLVKATTMKMIEINDKFDYLIGVLQLGLNAKGENNEQK